LRSFFDKTAQTMAMLGGIVLTMLIVLTCVSVLGRGLNTLGHSDLMEGLLPSIANWLIGTGVGPVTGDFELVQAGMAFTIFAFLPLCQLRAGHATVDIFSRRLPRRVNTYLTAFWEVALSCVIVLIAWRLSAGLAVKFGNGQTSFLLQFPIWWAYAASLVAAAIAALVGLFCAWQRLHNALTGQNPLPHDEGRHI